MLSGCFSSAPWLYGCLNTISIPCIIYVSSPVIGSLENGNGYRKKYLKKSLTFNTTVLLHLNRNWAF